MRVIAEALTFTKAASAFGSIPTLSDNGGRYFQFAFAIQACPSIAHFLLGFIIIPFSQEPDNLLVAYKLTISHFIFTFLYVENEIIHGIYMQYCSKLR